MQVRVLIPFVLIGAMILGGPLNSTSFASDYEEIAKYFESCIDREIKSCESKLVLLSSSKSENLQVYAKRQAQKAEFLISERNMLVEEMVEMQLEPKLYKFEFFINSQFYKRSRYQK